MAAASASQGVQVGDVLPGQIPNCNLGAFGLVGGLAPHQPLPPQNVQKEFEAEKESVSAVDSVDSVAPSVTQPSPRPQATIGKSISAFFRAWHQSFKAVISVDSSILSCKIGRNFFSLSIGP